MRRSNKMVKLIYLSFNNGITSFHSSFFSHFFLLLFIKASKSGECSFQLTIIHNLCVLFAQNRYITTSLLKNVVVGFIPSINN